MFDVVSSASPEMWHLRELRYVPYASSSFAARHHSPLDLLVSRPIEKSHFLAYMAYIAWSGLAAVNSDPLFFPSLGTGELI